MMKLSEIKESAFLYDVTGKPTIMVYWIEEIKFNKIKTKFFLNKTDAINYLILKNRKEKINYYEKTN
jgi:hypothetical protein